MILKRILPIFLIICLLLSSFACDSKNGQGENPITDFSVSFIDVGQGDCSFISFGDGKCMLIDTGNKNYEYSLKIINFIKNLGFSKIDYLVLTHPDLDHIGNANSIINVFPISQVFLPYILDFSLLAEYKSVVENLSLKQVKMQMDQFQYLIK